MKLLLVFNLNFVAKPRLSLFIRFNFELCLCMEKPKLVLGSLEELNLIAYMFKFSVLVSVFFFGFVLDFIDACLFFDEVNWSFLYICNE